ncbi:hypothetical protein SeMB42_g06687, partial [Synchytrium endobioticum]
MAAPGPNAAANTESTYPPPPLYYTYFTDANVHAVAEGQAVSQLVSRLLRPPPPSITGQYQVFGRWTDVQDEAATL